MAQADAEADSLPFPDLPPAGFWLRVGAWCIDQAVLFPPALAVIAAATLADALDAPRWAIPVALGLTLLGAEAYLFEMTRRRGQTVGKIAASIQVVNAAGEVPGAAVVLWRLLCQAFWVAMQGLCAPIGLADPGYVLISRHKQALHDVASETFVVRTGARRCRGLAVLAIAGLVLPCGGSLVIVRSLLVVVYQVSSGSMEPTLAQGDHLLCNRLAVRLRGPQVGDVIVFEAPVAAGQDILSPVRMHFVQRVVGVAGDRLRVAGGALHRNGRKVEEPYIAEPMAYTWPQGAEKGAEVVVPSGKLVVLGDSRNDCNDSHEWHRRGDDWRAEPFLSLELVRARAVARLWPPSRWGSDGLH